MFKYGIAALALKIFSLNNPLRMAYRKIGNVVGEKTRKKANIDTYLQRSNLFISLCKKYDAIQEDDKLLEIGTGWIHWYAIYLSLFYNVKITMMDVWDNRQFGALKAAFSKLGEASHCTIEEHSRKMSLVANAENFDVLYRDLNLDYIIDESSLGRFPNHSFDFIFSFHVLEHVPRERTSELVSNIFRILKPGGFSIHQIGIDDHLSHYDKSMSAMNYLRYSDMIWKIFFENEVQYFNRLLMADWLEIFDQKGFLLQEKLCEFTDISSLRIHSKYIDYSKDDLSCSNLTIVHKKPSN